MKSVFLIAVLFFSTTAHSDGKTCGVKKKGSDCEVVRVLTRCDVDKQALRRKIYALEKQLSELQDKYQRFVTYINEHPVLTKVVYVKNVVEKQVIRHNIISLYATRDVSNWNPSNGVLESKYEPGIKYQYQFDFGLVPEIGINAKGDPLFGLGFGF